MTGPALSMNVGGTPADRPVHALFQAWTRQTPDAPALIDGDRSWSYREVDRLADQVADTLRGRVGEGDLIGVCLDHGAALVTIALAAARLGAVYLPFGSSPGEHRLEEAVRTLRIKCLVGESAQLGQLHEATEEATEAVPVPWPADTPGLIAVFGLPTAPADDAPATAAHAYYAILTSGSTGFPKAVAVGGGSFGNVLHWYRELTGIGPGDRHSFLMGVGFDVHLLEMWAVLTSGAALSVAPHEVRWDSNALTDWWGSAGISVSHLPTSLAEPVLERSWPRGLVLRHLIIGGDRLRRWPARDVTAHVHNAYGPAEATVVTTVHSIPAGAEVDTTSPPPIGRPIPGATVFVTDQDGVIVPRGEPGELRIGGRCVSLGYLDAELTRQRFVSAPPGSPYPGRVYRTGDRVVMRPEGDLEFLGRLDDQVKVRGVRIEPAEVEKALEREPRVGRAVVTVRNNAAGTQLVAFVQSLAGVAEPTPAELRSHARKWLPEQAVPPLIKLISAFPVTANDKVDKSFLLASLAAEEADSAEHVVTVSDASPVELAVLDLCRAILGNLKIKLEDNFVEAGGNSIGGARLLATLEERYGVRLRAHQLLRQPDLRHIARLVMSEGLQGAETGR
jgi:amino acid adenylation domain-containing protein